MKKVLIRALCLSTLANLQAHTVLVLGAKGWVGQKIVTLLQEQGHTPIAATSRLENRHDIVREIQEIQPDYIINCAGITGKPNVDWCEDHRQETLRTNVLGLLNLVDVAYLNNIHVTNFTTGCIYEYDEKHPLASGIGFTEDEEPNCTYSFYSKTKVVVEKLILEYPNVLNLRMKMPTSTELDRGFVGKIINFKKVVNVPNSLCVLDSLLPAALDMTIRKITGNFNFVNPGTLSHHEVLELYKEYVDPKHTYESLSLEEQSKFQKVKRSNAELSAAKLLSFYPDIAYVKTALIKLFQHIAKEN